MNLFLTLTLTSMTFMVDVWAMGTRGSLPDETDKDFLHECLFFHNELRSHHDSPPLKLNAMLVKYSQDRLKNMTRFEKLAYYGHLDLEEEFGENIFRAISKLEKSTCEAAIKSWYEEITEYDFEKAEFNMKTGHFTQLIWADTKEMGCARALMRAENSEHKFEIYIVCNYKDLGNISGDFQKNVKTAKSDKSMGELFVTLKAEFTRYKVTKESKKEFDKLKGNIKSKSKYSANTQTDGHKGGSKGAKKSKKGGIDWEEPKVDWNAITTSKPWDLKHIQQPKQTHGKSKQQYAQPQYGQSYGQPQYGQSYGQPQYGQYRQQNTDRAYY